MEFVPGSIRLDDISGGTLGAGVVPLSRFKRDEQFATNAGIVTVLAAPTTLCSVVVNGLKVGDRVFAFGQVLLAKGATAGLSELGMSPSMSAGNCNFGNNNPPVQANQHPASTSVAYNCAGLGRIINADGNLTLTLYGTSAGSNATCAAGGASLHVFVMRDSA